jgi:hypothetical protein
MGRKILVVGILLISILFGMEKGYDYFLKRNMNLKPAFITCHRIDADVLFLGPCEPLWMMDPAVFQLATGLKAYNLATVHANFAENEAMLHLYLDHNKAPGYIFLYVTTESVDGAFNVFNTYAFAPYIDHEWIAAQIQEQDTSYFKFSRFPFMKYAYYGDYVHFNCLQGIKHTLSGRETPYFPNGYVPPHDMVWDGRLERFAKQYPKGRVFKWNPEEIKHLQSIVNQAALSGSQLVLYESPMLNEIKPYILNREEIREKISTFAVTNKIPYWVFDTMKISDSRDYFFSVLNTNQAGSAIFNKTFAAYFIQQQTEPWIKTPSDH